MKKIALFYAIIALFSCKVQQNHTAAKKNSADLHGFINKASFNTIPYNRWFHQNMKTYRPDTLAINLLQKELKGIQIKGFMGTWCKDSKREIPHFFKILEQANFNLDNLELIAVDRNKKTSNNLQKGFNVIRVPTFIFYKKEKEIGRYVEYARESLEKDMLTIILKQPYKHAYEN
jgi:thiol-disulfide isomerase/thioredoxin